jgi:hypothetical protein
MIIIIPSEYYSLRYVNRGHPALLAPCRLRIKQFADMTYHISSTATVQVIGEIEIFRKMNYFMVGLIGSKTK